MLSGVPEPFGEVDDEMLEQAKHNLREELVFFGLTERFDESLVLAKRRLGFRSILYRTSGRVNTSRPRGEEVPKELVEAAEACNRYDIELYRYATELFEAAPEREELEFEVELAALRAAKAEGERSRPRPRNATAATSRRGGCCSRRGRRSCASSSTAGATASPRSLPPWRARFERVSSRQPAQRRGRSSRRSSD